MNELDVLSLLEERDALRVERDELLALLRSLRSVVAEDYRHHIDAALAKGG